MRIDCRIRSHARRIVRRAPNKNDEADPATFTVVSGIQLSAYVCGYVTSAYLHRNVTASGSAVGRLPFLGRTSVCSLALIAAGSCERAVRVRGAKRPRSGAAGALEAAAREQIMADRGQGSEPRGGGFGGLAYALSSGDRGDLRKCSGMTFVAPTLSAICP